MPNGSLPTTSRVGAFDFASPSPDPPLQSRHRLRRRGGVGGTRVLSRAAYCPVRRGLLRLLAAVGIVAGSAGGVHAQVDDRVIRGLTFEGNNSIPAPVLEASIATTKSGWFARNGLVRWLGLGEKRYFDEVEFQRDVFRLGVLYKRSGFPDVQVDTLVRRDPENVWVTFLIEEGEPILVDTLIVAGLDSVPGWVRSRADLDLPLRQGDVFDRALMQADADSITRRLRDRGYPSADVLVSYAVRTAERRAAVTLDANPGVRARIGDVRVEGVERVDSSTVVDLMTARPGELYSQTDLFQSQRNLYNADLFRIATVDIDSANFEPGTDSVPLRVQVAESPPRRLRIGAGYGTNDCLRTNAGLTLRNFLGNGRLVDLSGSGVDRGMLDEAVSALGARRLLWGSDLTMCTGLAKLRALEVIGLAADDLADIRWRNAARIFPPDSFPRCA